ncbi:hypothetical protein AB0L70_24125 [Kribbella sp. NPDC051952]|uniref:hypothetical protein n=1 Tax=Kribbella sp. NPDC051952 TaxID=3154851 RepID=UPI00341A62D4
MNEILPGSWEYEWMARVVRAVEQRSGRPSNWNGKLYEETLPAAGHFDRDGSLSVHRAYVLEPARAAMSSDERLSSAEAVKTGQAAVLAVNLARQSLSAPGDDSPPGATKLGSLEDLALEQTLADDWTRNNSDEALLDDIGFGADRGVYTGTSMRLPAYSTATNMMMHSLAGHTGVPVPEVRATIEQTGRAQRFTAIADKIIDNKLEGLVPDDHRAEVREALAGPVRRELRGLTMTELSQLTHPGTKQSWGSESAEWAMTELGANLEDIESHYRGWQAEHPGTEPPRLPAELHDTFLDRQEEIREIWADRGWPAQEPVQGYEENAKLPDQPYPTAREQEVQDLQRFLWEHTAPAGPAVPATTTDNVHKLESRRSTERGVE